MAYTIEYGVAGELPGQKNSFRKIVAVSLIIVLVASAFAIKTIGLPWLQEVLLPGDPAVTAMALDVLMEDLRGGVSIFDALQTFCAQIVNGAYAS